MTGMGASGSSALCDLLREFDGFFVPEKEFRLLTDPDGLLSLESALIDNWTIYQSDLALQRFLRLIKKLYSKYSFPYFGYSNRKIYDNYLFRASERYINDLISFRYKGIWHGSKSGINIIKYLLIKKYQISRKTLDNIEVSKNLTKEEFIIYTRKFIDNIIQYSLKKTNKENIVFDEGLVAMNLDKILNYFNKCKVFIVIRDPRDIYCESNKWLFIPDKVNKFIKHQKQIYERFQCMMDKISSKDLMILRFEDLVYNYDESIDHICDFICEDKSKHSKRKTFFDPEVSAKNIGLWKRKANQSDINRIYQELNFVTSYYNFQHQLYNNKIC